MSLSQQTCVPCRTGAPKLTEKQIKDYLSKVSNDWQYRSNPDRITHTFTFKNFREALAFVNRVGEIAEKQGHHPNISLHDYKHVTLELFTHKIQGLHLNDFILASKIDGVRI